MATSIQTQNITQVCSFQITHFFFQRFNRTTVPALLRGICATIWYFQIKVYWAQGSKCLIEKGLV